MNADKKVDSIKKLRLDHFTSTVLVDKFMTFTDIILVIIFLAVVGV